MVVLKLNIWAVNKRGTLWLNSKVSGGEVTPVINQMQAAGVIGINPCEQPLNTPRTTKIFFTRPTLPA
jgi:hypothetical protein